MGSSVFYRFPNTYDIRTLHVPAGSLSAYETDTKWNKFFGTIVETGSGPAVPGDISGDGVLSITDVTMLINMLLSNGN